MPDSEQTVELIDVPVSRSMIAERPTLARFVAILGVFTAIYLLSWPVVFSLDLWILKDRGSFLNIEYLLDQHLRLGVDTFYSYGLLPVFIQHCLFILFGRGYWPLIGCAIVTMVLIALFCAYFLRYLPNKLTWFIALLALSRIVDPVNPNLPYSLVELSLLFTLLFVLMGRLEISLAISAVGCWSVPSLPLVMTASIAGLIFTDWFVKSPRSISRLLRALAPGLITYLATAILLASQFGWSSVFATATPLAGMHFYKQVNYGSRQALMDFLHPTGYRSLSYVAYALLTPVVWWVMSTLVVAVFGILAARRMAMRRALDNRDSAIVLCAVIQYVFVCVAYGSPHQHYIFDPILIVGVLLGLSTLPMGRTRRVLLTLFLGFGILGQATLARSALLGWKQVKSPAVTANLYADADWASEWNKILALSTHENLLFFAYSTGAHHYFPTVHSPNVWMLREGLLLPADKAAVMKQLDQSDVVVLDLTSPTELIYMDSDIQRQLYSLCLTQSTNFFQVWWRRSSRPANLACIANPRR